MKSQLTFDDKIQVIVEPRKYLNAPAPDVSDECITWVLNTLYHSYVNMLNISGHTDAIKQLRKVHIAVEQSYVGSGKLHIYVTINDNDKSDEIIHKTWSINGSFEQQTPPLYVNNFWGNIILPDYWLIDWFDAGIDTFGFGERANKSLEYERNRENKINTLEKHRHAQTFYYNNAVKLMKSHFSSFAKKLLSETEIDTLSEEQFLHWFDSSYVLKKTRWGINVI